MCLRGCVHECVLIVVTRLRVANTHAHLIDFERCSKKYSYFFCKYISRNAASFSIIIDTMHVFDKRRTELHLVHLGRDGTP